jgi:hypothetical protein
MPLPEVPGRACARASSPLDPTGSPWDPGYQWCRGAETTTVGHLPLVRRRSVAARPGSHAMTVRRLRRGESTPRQRPRRRRSRVARRSPLAHHAAGWPARARTRSETFGMLASSLTAPVFTQADSRGSGRRWLRLRRLGQRKGGMRIRDRPRGASARRLPSTQPSALYPSARRVTELPAVDLHVATMGRARWEGRRGCGDHDGHVVHRRTQGLVGEWNGRSGGAGQAG